MAKQISGKARVGLIGCGGIAGAHCQGYIDHARKIEVVALADISKENMDARAKQLAGLGGAQRQYADWKDLLEKEGDKLDAVDICLPHHLHRPAIIDAANAGKHILCEKPLCLTLKEADAIGEAVKKAGVTYMSAHNQLFMPCVAEAKKIITSGGIGDVYLVRSQDCFRIHRTREQWGWRATLKTQGGGEYIDTGYHPTYRLFYLAGSEPEAVCANFTRLHCKIEGEDTASVSVRFKNGAIGEILTSWAFPVPTGSYMIHILGDKGEIYGSGSELYWRPEGYAAAARKQLPNVNTFSAEVGHFADCLLEGRRPLHGFEEGGHPRRHQERQGMGEDREGAAGVNGFNVQRATSNCSPNRER
ncbi:MAG: Gfo/Idh/MocA family oxidoreductase [Planctomycetes bacterium]|nr:Gfo/Idh/MocA family oxidoreductase [Planctomycetota bacterium]